VCVCGADRGERRLGGQSEMRRRIGEGCRGVRSKWRLERHHRVLLRPMLLLLRPVLLLLWPVLQ
jgi:hypothetical protein